ncbi:ATP-binding protein [Brachybacterium alimentarium]|uniref:ATP-binding protein n=1 Tax=Brachybacterium alimentarium TaxID=47845 RepID=UPI003FD43A28
MTNHNTNASFTFSWLALKLLGRGLYSNPWNALSELVANGLDAGATDVHIYIDATNKTNATIEILDNGSGMSRSDIDSYVTVGRDKRKAEDDNRGVDEPMGRKGIGKLAALFLSPHFYISTKHANEASKWELDARDGNISDEEHPQLASVPDAPSTPNDELWNATVTGTRITILGVDLTGYGPQAIQALNTRLANQFLLPASEKPRVLLWVQRIGMSQDQTYERVEKSTAFGNFTEILHSFNSNEYRPIELSGRLPAVKIPAKGVPGGIFSCNQRHESLKASPEEVDGWAELGDDLDLENQTYKGRPFELTGWIGVHATIKSEAAQANDIRFTKNKFYNPAQIRLYVRGKLASDNILPQLGLTGTYVNYIEGEISFDLLDDDELPDIATANRQDFDQTDKRVLLLRSLVRPLVRKLMQGRNNLAAAITKSADREKSRRETAGKKHFTQQLHLDFAQYTEIPQTARDELHSIISNKIQGDVAPKQKYRIFISHASADQAFATLIDELLRTRGAREDEIFYTSRPGATTIATDTNALREVVRRNITDDNTLVFYLTSKNFMKSQYCLFEGGAGWATRAVTEYLKLNVEFEAIPGWLTNGRAEAVLLDSVGEIVLTTEIHNYLIDGLLNPMIDHLNRGRDIAGADQLERYVREELPSAVEMARTSKSPEDYFDPDIVEHWNVIVEPAMPSYLSHYH